MTKQTKTILIGWIGMIPLAAMIIFVLLQNLGVLEAHAAPVEDFIVEETEAVNEAELSAMPCIDQEAFRRWYENYNTSSEPVGSEEEATQPTLYRIAGQEIDPELQVSLFHHLEAEGIAYWYEGALAQMFQESSCDPYQVTNGLDYGIYQYRITFWNWDDGDIFDVDAQLRRYASEMAARFNSGLSVDEAISRHMTSDFVSTINREYVSDVKQWLSQMEVVR